MSFANMGIKKQLTTLVGVAVVGLILVVIVSVIQMKTIFEKANFNTVNVIPSMSVLNNVTDNVGKMRIRVLRHMMIDDVAIKIKLESEVKEFQSEIDKEFKKYDTSMIFDDEDRRLLANNITILNEYIDLAKKIMELSRQNKKEEMEIVYEAIQPVASKLARAIADHYEYNDRMAKKMSEEANQAENSAMIMELVISLIIAILVIVIGIYVVQNIIKSVNEVLNVANRIAEGDMSAKLVVDRNDEIGQLKSAMISMLNTVKTVQIEINKLIESAKNGELSAKANAEGLKGEWKSQIDGINLMLDTYI